MASEFITRVEHGKDEPYTIIFRTDDADKYKHIEDECRKMIGHAKPTVDAVPVVRCSECVHFAEWTAYEKTHFGFQDDGMCKYWNCTSTNKNGFCYQAVRITDGYCADGERRTDETEGS